jgi:hypothetical protein
MLSIYLVLRLIQNADAVKPAKESSSFEQAPGILLVQSEEFTSSVADLGHGILNTPELALAAKAILADQLQLLIQPLLEVGHTRRKKGLAIFSESIEKTQKQKKRNPHVV